MEIWNIHVYSFLTRREKFIRMNARARSSPKNKCSVTFVDIERLWHRISKTKAFVGFCFVGFWFFFLCLSFFISIALPLSKSAGDDDTLSTYPVAFLNYY